MKKLFSIVLIALMSIVTLNAETTRIYCKMAQSWWTADGAAVGCHSWETGTGAGTTWPGVRMTPVEGETDLWYIDLDVTKVQNVIFTRVNPSGNIADWGAKTGDLVIPTNGDNLFTITKSSECWAGNDCTCDGTWSKYTAPVVTEPTVSDITITGDKYVGTELTFAAKVAGFSADPDIIYEVKAGKGDYEQAQGGKYTPAAAGDYTVKATAFYQPEEGDAEEASKEVAFTVTEVPVKEYYLVGWINGANSGCEGDAESFHEEYKFVDGTLTTTFTETSYVFVKTSGNNNWYLAESYVAPATKVDVILAEGKTEKVAVNGNVEVTFTLTENADGTLTLSYEEAAAPVKYYAKNNWNGAAAEDWSWLEMSATNKENIYVLDSVVFGGTGVNINTKEEDTDAFWFDVDHIVILDGDYQIIIKKPIEDTVDSRPIHVASRHLATEEPQPFKLQAGDTIMLFFNAADTTLQAGLLGRPAPAARKEFVFVAGEAADSDPAMFAITWGNDGSSETVKMEKQKEALYAADILATVDSVVLVRCATGATEIIWDGEGKNVWNQTANYELCDTMYFGEWTEEGLFTLTCETPKPVETKYYAKNNWNGAAAEDWSWLEMSATNKENIYMLDSVVFGGTGININTKEDDTDALWFAADAITVLDGLDGLPGPIPPEPRKRDTIPYAPARMVAPLEAPTLLAEDTLDGMNEHGLVLVGAPTLLAGDTIKLFFNAADSTLKAAIVGRPEPCEGEFGILVNETYIPAALNEARQDVVEYMLLDVALNAGDLVQIYDKCNETPWIITEYMPDSYKFHVTPDNKYIIQDGEADSYSFYFQLGPDKLYVLKGQSPTGMNEIESNATIQKIVRDGHLYIMVNEQVYNVQGIRVQ